MLQIHLVSYTVAMEVQMVQSFLLLTTHLASAGQCYPYGRQKNLKYKEVVLPENINNKKTGYHAEYYREFTALGRNGPPKNDDVESKSVHIRSKSTLANGSSSTIIMPKICIFCTEKDIKRNGSKQKLISVEMGDLKKRSRNMQQP